MPKSEPATSEVQKILVEDIDYHFYLPPSLASCLGIIISIFPPPLQAAFRRLAREGGFFFLPFSF